MPVMSGRFKERCLMFHAGEIDYPTGDGGLQGEMLEPAVCPAEDGGLQRAEDYPAEDDRWVRSCKSPN